MHSEKIILSHIAAVSQNHVIGLKGRLPWNIPEDLQYFYSKTKNRILIMGRKTFESLGKALPSRLNVVLTKNQSFKAEGALVFGSFEEALRHCKKPKLLQKYSSEIFIGGGGDLYKQTLPLAGRLYITRIYQDYEGDAFYPKIPSARFKETSRRDRLQPVPFSFLLYERIP